MQRARIVISVTQWSLDGLGLETIKRAAELGFETIHLNSGALDGDLRLDDDGVRDRYRRAALDCGVTIGAISGGDREIMQRPSFGQLTQLFCSFCSGIYDDVRGAGYDSPVHAYLCDFGVHHLDVARWLGGEVREASAYHDERGGGVSFAIALRFENGAVANLQLNSQRVWWRNYDRIEITGQGEYIVIDGLWGSRHYTATDNTFSENYSDERSTELGGDGAALTEFVGSIREGRPPVSSIQDAVRTMCLYQAVYDAYLAGRQGRLDLPEP